MSANYFASKVVNDKASYVPTGIAEAVRGLLISWGLCPCTGALDWPNCNVVIYLS